MGTGQSVLHSRQNRISLVTFCEGDLAGEACAHEGTIHHAGGRRPSGRKAQGVCAVERTSSPPNVPLEDVRVVVHESELFT